MNNIKGSILGVLALVMLLAQVGVAQHASVHFTDHGHYEHSHDGHDHGDENNKTAQENCSICLLTKALGFGIVPEQALVYASLSSDHGLFQGYDLFVSNQQLQPYNPRAPPTFLI